MREPIATRAAVWADGLLALAFAAVTQLEVWLFTADDGYSPLLRAAVSAATLAASASLAWRRRRPFAAYWVNAAGVLAAIALGFPSDVYQWTNLVVLYSVAAHGSSRQAWLALPAGVLGVAAYFARFPAEGGILFAAFAAAMWVVGWLAGRVYGGRIAEMQLRYERDVSRSLAEAREESLALEEERNRIARELHDIIGHTVNVMVVHAGAARVALDRDPAAVRRALDVIETTGRSALGELDRVLAVLRSDPAEEAAPGLADLPALSAAVEQTGLEVDLLLSGPVEQVPASVGLAAYRIVQESLTNALKHSGARRASVAVEVGSGTLRVQVDDDGHGSGELVPGRGIRGMRERAALHRGSVEVGRGARGGMVVDARLEWDVPA